MKKIILSGAAFLLAAGIFAQSVPQPAFRLLDGYLERRTVAAEYGVKAGPWFMMGVGTVLGGAAAATITHGDQIYNSTGWVPLDPSYRTATTVGLVAGSALLLGVGISLHLFPPVIDERKNYSDIYNETDAALQESLAAARIQTLSENAQATRMIRGALNLAVTGAAIGFQAYANVDAGKIWSDGVLDRSWDWEAGSLIGGVTSLLLPSPEERLYKEYQLVTGFRVK